MKYLCNKAGERCRHVIEDVKIRYVVRDDGTGETEWCLQQPLVILFAENNESKRGIGPSEGPTEQSTIANIL